MYTIILCSEAVDYMRRGLEIAVTCVQQHMANASPISVNANW